MNQDMIELLQELIAQFAQLPEGASASTVVELEGGLVIALKIGDAGLTLKVTDR